MIETARIPRRIGWLVLLLLNQAVASGPAASFGSKKNVTIEDFQPHLMDDEGYHEEWSHGVWMQDGSFISVDFFISNLGIGDHKGAVRLEYKDAEGLLTKCKMKYDSDEWSYQPNYFALKFGKNKLSGDLKSLHLVAKCEKISMNLIFHNEAEPFMPGSGKLRFGKQDQTYGKVFTVPRAQVTGELELKGIKILIKGVGQADHSTSNTYPYKYVRRWFRFQSIKEDFSINIAEMEATSKYANVGNGWVSITSSNGKIVATTQAKFQYGGFIEDSRSDPKYRIPRLVKFTAVDGDKVVSGKFIMQRIKKVRDPLKDLSSVTRLIVRRFTKPKDYHIACRYQLKVESPSQQQDQIIRGEGTYRLVFATP